jgi:ADP-ribose pyrophosphatase YjhB (NUDIX family)
MADVLRRSIAAAALIRRRHEGQVVYLARWNRHWAAFHLVAGHKRPEESFREALIREVGEELRLEEGTDFVVSPGPLAHLEYEAWSERTRAPTAYVTEVFEVVLSGSQALARIEADPENRWLTVAEIRDGRAADGQRVSPTTWLILSRITAGPGGEF